MQVILNETEVKKAVEYYLLQKHNLTVQSEYIQFRSKQDKVIALNGVMVTLKENNSIEDKCL